MRVAGPARCRAIRWRPTPRLPRSSPTSAPPSICSPPKGPAHGINGKIVLPGWSAGGHLTAACLGHPRVGAGLAISGIYELGPVRDTYLNDKLKLSDSEIETLSPLRLPMIKKPLAITYGTA